MLAGDLRLEIVVTGRPTLGLIRGAPQRTRFDLGAQLRDLLVVADDVAHPHLRQ
jgi:hypothetical protein